MGKTMTCYGVPTSVPGAFSLSFKISISALTSRRAERGFLCNSLKDPPSVILGVEADCVAASTWKYSARLTVAQRKIR